MCEGSSPVRAGGRGSSAEGSSASSTSPARSRPPSGPASTLPVVATALYRRYRPETFAEVIGQEHVTDPLRVALRAGRVGHAYLFSGPRGCGKTTSARILARCLNCAQGPTDTPCGVCDSCTELARGGSGSLDVVEIDAASHGGVDDARELRDRATFATARDRYKVFIIDEAHMVSPQGFNALLKIVEEPPPHVKFVFATTEPDKVLGTIRSRTHHYPFHLVAPARLQSYLAELCATEGVDVGPGVLPLVVRAGAGSVRDSLSVLDQLAAGSDDAGIDHTRAIALLGYTPATLLDDVIAALAVGDGATVFRVVDRVVQSGQDPRRFVDDLLQRLRDLIIVDALGERAHEVFPDTPADQLDRMEQQAAAYGSAPLSRAADLANAASAEMTGATSPRLHLELLGARMLLPAADDAERGLGARLDRLERRLAVPAGVTPAEPHARPGPVAPPAPAVPAPVVGVSPAVPVVLAPEVPTEAAPVREVLATVVEVPVVPAPVAEAPVLPAPERTAHPPTAQAAQDGPPHAGAPLSTGSRIEPGTPDSGDTAESTEAVRRMWPDVLDHLAGVRRRTWTRVSHDAQVLQVDGRRLVLQFHKPGPMAAFTQGQHADFVRESLVAVLGLDREVVAVAAGAPQPPVGTVGTPGPERDPVTPSRDPGASRSAARGEGGAGAPGSAEGPTVARPAPGAAARRPAGTELRPPISPTPGWEGPPPSDDDAPPEDEPPPEEERRRSRHDDMLAAAQLGGTASRSGSAAAAVADDEPRRDDDDVEDSALVGAALVEQVLGGRLISDDGRG